MKKIVVALLAVLALSVSTVGAAIVKPITPASSTLTVAEFKKMSPKEFEKMTGQKMNFFQKMKFKAAKLFAKPAEGGKSQLTAALLCFFLGGIGIHRFYLGYTWQGIVQILTLGGLGIWALIDFVRILTGSLQPKNGEYEKTF